MKKNILIAVTVIASLCLLYWGIEFLKGVNMFKPANFYYAEFEKVDGLIEAAPVSINGFTVGQVREICGCKRFHRCCYFRCDPERHASG